LRALDETDLIKVIFTIYDEAQLQGFAEHLPEPFLACYARLQDNPTSIQRDDLLIALQEALAWIINQLEAKTTRGPRIDTEKTDDLRAPRPDAPMVTDPTYPVGPGCCCDDTQILRLLGIIRSRIGSVDQCSCEETILSILGDACEILGPCATISGALQELLICCTVLRSNECSPTIITQTDVYTTTFTITEPGRYIFAENISFIPDTGMPAIDITSSHVTLDIICHTLSQGNTTAGVNAINVAPNLSNIIITHGAIQNFTRTGISVDQACSRIFIDGVTTFGCETRGIELLGNSGAGNHITESEISNCRLISCCAGSAGDIVLTLSHCTDVRVTSCRINQNGTTSHALQAVRLDNALKCELKDIEANDNLASSDFRGFNLSQATNSVFKNCITKNNQATAALSNNYGFLLESNTSSTANEFFDCSALNLTGTASVDGFFTGTGCDDNLFMRCESAFNSSLGSATTAIVHGFNVISNSRNMYLDCIARNNSAPNSTATPAPAFGGKGFDLNTCTGCNLIRCLATDQSTGAGSSSVGIHLDQGSQCSIRDCQSSRHSVGFRLDPNQSFAHVFSRNFAEKNTTQYSQFPIGSTENAANIANINAQLRGPWSNVSVG
jgi:hypothetical protein